MLWILEGLRPLIFQRWAYWLMKWKIIFKKYLHQTDLQVSQRPALSIMLCHCWPWQLRSVHHSTPRKSNSVLSKTFLTVHKSKHNNENQLFWRTEIYNQTLRETPRWEAWVLLFTLAVSVVYMEALLLSTAAPPPPLVALIVRRTARTAHWLMRLFWCWSWGVTTSN